MHARIQARDETRKVLELTTTNYACSHGYRRQRHGSYGRAHAASVRPGLATVTALVVAVDAFKHAD